VPRTAPVYGSTYTVCWFSPSSGSENTTCVVASPVPGWIADNVPSGWAARAAAIWFASGSIVSPRSATVSWSP